MPVLIGTPELKFTLGVLSLNHWNIVLGQGSEIVHKAKYGDAETREIIEGLLAQP